jgi:hypothetical protein
VRFVFSTEDRGWSFAETTVAARFDAVDAPLSREQANGVMAIQKFIGRV